MPDDVVMGILWYVVRNAPACLVMFFLVLLAVRGRLRFSFKATVGIAAGIIAASCLAAGAGVVLFAGEEGIWATVPLLAVSLASLAALTRMPMEQAAVRALQRHGGGGHRRPGLRRAAAHRGARMELRGAARAGRCRVLLRPASAGAAVRPHDTLGHRAHRRQRALAAARRGAGGVLRRGECAVRAGLFGGIRLGLGGRPLRWPWPPWPFCWSHPTSCCSPR